MGVPGAWITRAGKAALRQLARRPNERLLQLSYKFMASSRHHNIPAPQGANQHTLDLDMIAD